MTNNIFWNGGTISGQASAVRTGNFDSSMGDPKFADVASFDVHLLAGSPCIDQGKPPGVNKTQSLEPVQEYVQPLKQTARSVGGAAIDIGAYEYQNPGVVDGGVTADDGGGGGGTTGDGGTTGGGTTGGGTMAGGCGCVIGGSAAGGVPSSAVGGFLGVLAFVLRRRKR